MEKTITQREAQIWALSVKGLTKKEIANKLNRSYHTVNQIYRNLYNKLGVRKETDLVREWFLYNSFVTKEELKEAIKNNTAPYVIVFLLITSMQIMFDTPALRIRNNTRVVTRRPEREKTGRRKKTYYV